LTPRPLNQCNRPLPNQHGQSSDAYSFVERSKAQPRLQLRIPVRVHHLPPRRVNVSEEMRSSLNDDNTKPVVKDYEAEDWMLRWMLEYSHWQQKVETGYERRSSMLRYLQIAQCDRQVALNLDASELAMQLHPLLRSHRSQHHKW
jgi:hypothetical protein